MKIDYMLDAGAFAPVKAHDIDAGFDLRSPERVVLHHDSNVVIDTGVHVFIPVGYCGLLTSKSGLNVKDDITGTGLIDSGYTGSIRVKLNSHGYFKDGKVQKVFEAGDKIIQLMILPVPEVELNEVQEIPYMGERGNNGFGSTGK